MKTNRQRIFVCLLILFSTSACRTLKVAEERNFSNTKEIGVEWSTSGRIKNVGDNFDQQLDSMMMLAMEKFNQRQSNIIFRKKGKKDKDYISFDINDAKVVSKTGKTTGYIVSGVGLLGAPVAILIASEYTFFLAFWYFPEHKLLGRVDLGGNLVGDKGYWRPIGATKGALFGSNKKQLPKLHERFMQSVDDTFDMISKRLEANGKSSTK